MKYHCHICNKEFKHKSSLKKHLDRKVCEKYTKMQFQCNLCPKKYSSKISLNTHIRNKHGTKKIITKVQVMCPLCNSTFSDKYVLKRHLNNTCRNKMSQYNNVINNITNITNITNNINIQINNFGNENMDNISMRKLMNSIRSIENMPLDYIKLKYIDTPENRNIYLHDRDDKEMYIYKNGEWVKEDKIKILNKMFVGAIDDINELNKNNNTGKRKEKVDSRLDTIEHENKMDNFQLGRVQNVNINKNNHSILYENFKNTNGKVIELN